MLKELLIRFGEKTRWSAYFLLDRLKGGKVYNKFNANKDAYSSGSSETLLEQRITDILTHAVKTTQYYKNFDPSAGLSSFPIVNKQIWRDHYDEFRSSSFRDSKTNRIMKTSGSTGTPFSMIQDRGKIINNTADSIFLSSVGGYRIGEKIAFIRVWINGIKKSRIQLFMENMLMLDCTSLNDEAILKMLQIIQKEGVSVLTGYTSAFEEISKYIKKTGYDLRNFRVHAILPISESMNFQIREQLSKQFGCPVCSYYSNEENGIMGIQDPKGSEYYINSESYYFEILKMDSDEPCEEGELGRIVITDLNNYAFPVIRYDNGDTARAVKHIENGKIRFMLTEIYGRRIDILYDTKGQPVNPHMVSINFWNTEGIKQYQFQQIGEKEYRLLLNGDRQKMNVDEMIQRIQPAFGADAKIDVEYVDEIPVLSSGKRRYIANLYRHE